MNKVMLIFAPVVAAGIMFGATGSNFMKSGIHESIPENMEYYSLSEKGKNLIMYEIVSPIQKKKKTNKAEMYSRCPSGVTYFVTSQPTNDDPHFSGKVIDRIGCSSEVVCYFRLDQNEIILEAKSAEQAEYIPVAEWKKSMEAKGWSF